MFSLEQLFDNVSYEIDYYQREYTWGAEEVRTLVMDLREAFRDYESDRQRRRRPSPASSYFLGPFVYYEEDPRARGKRRFLVDGQQRFITLHLLLLQLRNIAKELQLRRSLPELDRAVFSRDRTLTIGIAELAPVLRVLGDGRDWDIAPRDSLSVRNLVRRSRQITEHLHELFESDQYEDFVPWLLKYVMLAGIQATDADHGYRMFETMNDRGARLTPVDLLKSHLLSHVGENADELNRRWRQMLAELTIDRSDTDTASQFIKCVLLARYADQDETSHIEANLNVWARKNSERLGLRKEHDYFEFVENLLDIATRAKPFLVARTSLKEGYETVYFNERNGLSEQLAAVLAVIQPTDTLSEAAEKGRAICDFIDRWYVLQILRDRPVSPSEVGDLVYGNLVPSLRGVQTSKELMGRLAEMMAGDPLELSESSTFGLRPNNTHQVRYVLARLTAFVETGIGHPCDTVELLSSDKYDIEHLWAKHHGRVAAEIPDPVAFRARRNQLGALGLLPKRTNSSLNDLPLAEKLPHYSSHNALLGVLAPGYGERKPELQTFIKRHHLQKLMHRFAVNAKMMTIVETRQRLMLTLCALIWDPKALDRPPSETSGTPPRRRRTTHVAKMVDAGVIAPGTSIVMTHQGADHWAEIDAEGGIILRAVGGTPFDKVDDAGAVVKGTSNCSGMAAWHIVDPMGQRVSLRSLRERAIADGRLPSRGSRQRGRSH
ncbi:DUF262 domain-containing protein [Actinomadura sp. GC306]|uniref:GmrSD restriction endonuclease domain-containing protein n=1 Tax=Actinomadura sp. GC306 TaxID=2530367 RepID=UPI001404950F|nr:DUF262 domain-containing protein [Actinomadura sp. GC306]